MKSFFKVLWIEFSNHNRYKTIAGIFCIVLLIYINGCQVKCHSVLYPAKEITAEELQAEVDFFMSRAEIEANNINRQEILRQYLWNTAITTASAGSFNWLQFLTGAGTLIGGGAFADNIRFRIKLRTKNPS